MKVTMYTIYITFKKMDSRDKITTLDLCDEALKIRQDVLECMTKLFMYQKEVMSLKMPSNFLNQSMLS